MTTPFDKRRLRESRRKERERIHTLTRRPPRNALCPECLKDGKRIKVKRCEEHWKK